VIGDTPGCFIGGYDPENFADNLSRALDYAKQYRRTKGRDRIKSIGLDSVSVAEKLIQVYTKVLK
jgi:hypothetical protein